MGAGIRILQILLRLTVTDVCLTGDWEMMWEKREELKSPGKQENDTQTETQRKSMSSPYRERGKE